jgi:hypothetical protein
VKTHFALGAHLRLLPRPAAAMIIAYSENGFFEISVSGVDKPLIRYYINRMVKLSGWLK